MPSRTGDLGRRALLVVLVQAGFYVLGWGVVAAALGVLGLEIWADRLTLGGVAAGVFAAWFAWALIPPWRTWTAPGLRLDPTTHPRLFEMLDELAGQAGLRSPHDVYLVNEVNAFIGRRRAGLRSRRFMGIGLPMFQVLTVGELRAVLAHEFGHQHQGDVRLGPWIHGSRAAIASALSKMDDDGVGLHLFFNWYGRLYVRMSQEISREQELHADAVSASLAGRDPALRALRRTEETGGAWAGYWHSELLPVLNRGLRPPIFDGFARYLASERVRARLERERADAGDEAEPYDSHPTLAERERALRDATELAPRPGDEASARVLLDGAETLYLDHIAVDGAQFRELAWKDIGEAYWLPRWRNDLGPHVHALRQLTLGRIPHALTDIDSWGERLRGAGPNMLSVEATRRRTRALLAMWAAIRLADAGWRIESLPGEAVVAILGERRIAPFELVDAVVAGEAEWPGDLM